MVEFILFTSLAGMSFLLIRRFATPKREPNAVPKLFGKLAFGNVTVQLAKILPQSNSKLENRSKRFGVPGRQNSLIWSLFGLIS